MTEVVVGWSGYNPAIEEISGQYPEYAIITDEISAPSCLLHDLETGMLIENGSVPSETSCAGHGGQYA
jgi:hypothetical protein